MILPKTNFCCIRIPGILLIMTLVIYSHRLMFCCVDLLPQDQTPHTSHQFLHLFWDSLANCRYLHGWSRPNNGTHIFYGVDVNDVHRYFTDQGMSDLGPRGQAYVFEQRLAQPQ